MQNTNQKGIIPKGEIAERIALTAKRLSSSAQVAPRFNDEFILADVTLDERRRFFNFSGDLSGRYVGALASLQSAENAELNSIVERILREQKLDGRFGNEELSFAGADIANQQMALLWGNGRLLVGLMEFYERQKDEKVLAAAVRLGEFLANVEQACAQPEIRERLAGQGAFGFICFTQLAEGLVLLARHSGERRFLETARKIVPLLPPRGVQHSHGYLSTLRGVVMLYEATGEGEFLEFAERHFNDLVASPDYVLYGSPLEYFGWESPEVTDEDRAVIIRESGADPRSEGCSEADFIRLALQLWRATQRVEYLEYAEKCLLNSFYYNQFDTGDFGHHVLFRQGLKPTESVGRAWWCCTMHGYRAFPDILEAIFTEDSNLLSLNLFVEAEIEKEDYSLALEKAVEGFEITVARVEREKLRLAVRLPRWAEIEISVNGTKAEIENENGYAVLPDPIKTGDRISIGFDNKIRFVTRDGKDLELAELSKEPSETALFYGAYLMSADERREPFFFGEPWQKNVIYADSLRKSETAKEEKFAVSTHHLTFDYRHDGFAENGQVTLRPLSEQTAHGQGIIGVWLNFAKRN